MNMYGKIFSESHNEELLNRDHVVFSHCIGVTRSVIESAGEEDIPNPISIDGKTGDVPGLIPKVVGIVNNSYKITIGKDGKSTMTVYDIKVQLQNLTVDHFIQIVDYYATTTDFIPYWLQTDELIVLIYYLAKTIGKHGDQLGMCPDARNQQPMATCPGMLKTNPDLRAMSGQVLINKFLKLVNRNQDLLDIVKTKYCSNNPSEYVCDCLSASNPAGFYNPTYVEMNKSDINKTNPFFSTNCWLPACRDNIGRFQLLNPDHKMPSSQECPVPDCLNICVHCQNGNNNSLIQQICQINPDDPFTPSSHPSDADAQKHVTIPYAIASFILLISIVIILLK